MSTIAILVFAPVVLGGVFMFALLLGAAAAGTLEAVERRPRADGPVAPRVAPREVAPARAA